MLSTQKRLSYEDYLALPETMQRYEIIDGELIMPPAPLIGHQWRSSEINELMKLYVRTHRLGLVLYAPVDVMIRRRPLRTRQPDVLFLSFERLRAHGIENLESLEEMPFLDFAPDLVVEIVSPGETVRKIQSKLRDYRRIGVRECWLVRPADKTVEVLRLEANAARRIGLFHLGEVVQSEVLTGWNPAVDTLFAQPDWLKSDSAKGGRK